LEEPEMTEREKIMGRIREALTVSAPRPGPPDAGEPAPATTTPSAHAREWLPAAGETFEEQLVQFRDNAANLKADFYPVTNRDGLLKLLIQLRDEQGWKKIASHSGELTDFASLALGLPVLKTDSAYDVNELEKCDAGITECDALIAQTGSVLVTSRSAGGRCPCCRRITWSLPAAGNCCVICRRRFSC
jgi:L-lactate dehydrogenase complex protein LldG